MPHPTNHPSDASMSNVRSALHLLMIACIKTYAAGSWVINGIKLASALKNCFGFAVAIDKPCGRLRITIHPYSTARFNALLTVRELMLVAVDMLWRDV